MDNAESQINSAPLPTAKTLAARKSLGIQFGRFIAINIKIMRIIQKTER